MFKSIKNWFMKSSLLAKVLVLLVIIGIIWFIASKFFSKNSQATQYQTAKAEKGTLIVTVTGSGTVSAANSGSISTQASGVVSKIYVNNGDVVKAGDPIAEFQLDEGSQQKYMAALSAYQSAKNNLDNANTSLYTLQSDMFTKWSDFMELAQSSTYQNADGSPNNVNRGLPEFHISQDDWLAAEAKYKTQQAVIAQAQSALSSAWYSYRQSSPIVYAPISGTVTGLSLQPGTVITQSNSTSTTTTSSQKVASVVTTAEPTVSINLSEIDVPKVKVGNKATVTLDALSGKTFTGKIISIDIVGVVSSGVTTYPVVIKLDSASPEILSNMNASASIITQTKDNVLLVPSSAVQSDTNGTYVRIMKNGAVSEVSVETGLSSSTQTEITSGLSEGDTVVTSVTATGASTTTGQTTSPFSAIGGGRGGFGGGAVRFNRN